MGRGSGVGCGWSWGSVLEFAWATFGLGGMMPLRAELVAELVTVPPDSGLGGVVGVAMRQARGWGHVQRQGWRHHHHRQGQN